jgi:hypothetical protein
MGDSYTKLVLVIVVILAATVVTTTTILTSFQRAAAFIMPVEDRTGDRKAAPIATSGDNVYVAWWTNKTGNDEVMFKASADNGKTFGDKMNLSNTINSQSQDVSIAASGNNVYVSWWERNATSNEPVMRVSNDNGKTFGDTIELSNNTTLPK